MRLNNGAGLTSIGSLVKESFYFPKAYTTDEVRSLSHELLTVSAIQSTEDLDLQSLASDCLDTIISYIQTQPDRLLDFASTMHEVLVPRVNKIGEKEIAQRLGLELRDYEDLLAECDTGFIHNIPQSKADLEYVLHYMYLRDRVETISANEFIKRYEQQTHEITRGRPWEQVELAELEENLKQMLRRLEVEPAMRWLRSRLDDAIDIIPKEILKSGGYAKLMRTIVGIVSFASDPPETKGGPAWKGLSFEKAVKAGFYFGITYPLVDDLIDMKGVISDHDKSTLINLLDQALLTGAIADHQVPDMPVAKALKKVFEELLELFPFEQTPHLYKALYSLHRAQTYDALLRLDSDISDKDLYSGVMIKAGWTRVVVAELTGSPINRDRYKDFLLMGLRNQLSDDLSDIHEDLAAGRVTAFTRWLTAKDRSGMLNPVMLYSALATYFSDRFDNSRMVEQTLALRAQHLLKLLKLKKGPIAGRQLLLKLKTGIKELDQAYLQAYKLCENHKDAEEYLMSRTTNRSMVRREAAEEVQKYLKMTRQLLEKPLILKNQTSNILAQAMNYSLSAGGKRFRPMLALMAGDIFNIENQKLTPLLISLEMLHTASLIIDDLPSQDNSELRRGMPTLHRRFGESIAQLSSVALIARAYQELTKLSSYFGSDKAATVIDYCSEIMGYQGLCLGQQLDLSNLGEAKLTSDDLIEKIYFLKTSLALEGPLVSVAILSDADSQTINQLKKFARHLGMGFQLQDDLIDMYVDSEESGKDSKKDSSAGLCTYLAKHGELATRIKVAEQFSLAYEIINGINHDTKPLRALVAYLLNRNY